MTVRLRCSFAPVCRFLPLNIGNPQVPWNRCFDLDNACRTRGAISPLSWRPKHSAYDHRYARRCWRVLSQADRVMKQFGSGFLGKGEPRAFFLGSFDLAVSVFRTSSSTHESVPYRPFSCGRAPLVVCGVDAGRAPVFMPAFTLSWRQPEGIRQITVNRRRNILPICGSLFSI